MTLAQEVVVLGASSRVDLLRAIIRRHSLPISPQIGGSSSRTKFMILQELRAAAGLPPLLRRQQRGRPRGTSTEQGGRDVVATCSEQRRRRDFSRCGHLFDIYGGFAQAL